MEQDLEDGAGSRGCSRTCRTEQDLEEGLEAYADPTTGSFSSDL